MGRRVTGRIRTVALLAMTVAAGAALPAAGAFAAMGTAAIMDRFHPKEKGKLTMDEVRDAAASTYDTISEANGGKVSMLQLGGRVSEADLKEAKIGNGEVDDTVSKADYLTLASHFFAKANVSRQKNVAPADGTLSEDELSTPAGKKLVRLIE